MSLAQPQKIWLEQCAATESIRKRHGVDSAFEHLVGEKLLNFAEVAEQHPEFARELPAFVAAVRQLFDLHELRHFLTKLERELALSLQEDDGDGGDEDEIEFLREAAIATEKRIRRLQFMQELLLADRLGTA